MRWVLPCAIAAMAPTALTGCDPLVERGNPYDPQAPVEQQALGTIVGQVSRAELGGDQPATGALVRVEGAADVVAVVEVDREGRFEVGRVVPGPARVVITLPGHAPAVREVDVGIGDAVTLDAVVLVDRTPPPAPRITVAGGLVDIATPDIELIVHNAAEIAAVEPGATLEVAVDDAADVTVLALSADAIPLRLAAGDGDRLVRVAVVDRSGNTSPEVARRLALDTTPPLVGLVEVLGEVDDLRSTTVRIAVSETDATRAGVRALDVAEEDVWSTPCPELACDRPLNGTVSVDLPEARGHKQICVVLCDDVGNRTRHDPIPVCLGPHRARPLPVLARFDAVSPANFVAGPDAPLTLVVSGSHIQPDTLVELGPFTDLPCVSAPAAGSCPTAEPEPATACTVELPRSIRLNSGRYPVRLRTPAPVEGGHGRSEDVGFLVVDSPYLRVDRIEPPGLAVADGPEGIEPAIAEIDLWLRDVNDNARFRLGGREGDVLRFERDDDDPSRVHVRVAFDLTPLAGAVGGEVPLTITNPFPAESTVEVPFGLTPSPIRCPVDAPCEVLLRGSRPRTDDGRIVIDLAVPVGPQLGGLVVEGAEQWQVLDGRDDTLLWARAEVGRRFVPLPAPLPRAIVRAYATPDRGGMLRVQGARQAAAEDVRLAEAPTPLGGIVSHAVFADLDLDGRVDAIASQPFLGQIVIAWGGPDDRDPLPMPIGRNADASEPGALAVGDLNGDGLPDLAIADEAGRAVTVLRNQGQGAFGLAARLDAAAPVSALAIGDLHGPFGAEPDGRPEVWAVATDGRLLRWHRAPDGRFDPAPTAWAIRRPATQLSLVDFDEDGRRDVLLGGPGGGGWLRNGPSGLEAHDNRCGACRGTTVSADFDGDGALDTITLEEDGDGAGLVLIRGRSGEARRTSRITGCALGDAGDPCATGRVMVMSAGDFDLDGRSEVLAIDGAAEQPFVIDFEGAALFGDALDLAAAAIGEPVQGPIAMTFDGRRLLAVTTDGMVVRRVIDVDSDGLPCDDPPDLPRPRHTPGAVAWVDFDRDGRDDLLTLHDGRLMQWRTAHAAPWISGSPRDAVTGCAAAEPLEGQCEHDEQVYTSFEGFSLIAAGGQVLVEAWGAGRAVFFAVDRGLLGPIASGPVAEGIERRPVSVASLYPPGALDDVGGVVWLEVGNDGAALWDDPMRAPDGGPAQVRVAQFEPGGAEEVLVEDETSAALWRLVVPDGEARPVPVSTVVGRFEAELGEEAEWAAGDMDGDGQADRVSVTARGSSDVAYLTVHRGLPDAPGEFDPAPLGEPIGIAPIDPAASGAARLSLADVNRDGALDVLVLIERPVMRAEQRTIEARAFVCYGRGGGLTTACQQVVSRVADVDEPSPATFQVADPTGDGLPDLVFGQGEHLSLAPLAPDGEWPFRAVGQVELSVAPGAIGEATVPASGMWASMVGIIVDHACRWRADAPRPTLTVVAPNGNAVTLNLFCERTSTSNRGGAMRALWGRQPAGEWRIVVDRTDDPDPEPLVIRRVELAFVARFRRTIEPAAAWDADDDGLAEPQARRERDRGDPCPAAPSWGLDPVEGECDGIVGAAWPAFTEAEQAQIAAACE